jgi:outer membrane protein assembly factor BamE (lipoprotein component of BamABCDE complex)
MPKRPRRAVATIIALVLAGSLAACSKTVEQRGNQPTAEKVAEIKPGISTQEDVTRILGTPSSVGTFDDKTWYYISRRTEQLAFLTPDLVDQQVIAVSFDEQGLVREVRRHGMDERRAVTPVARSTPAAGKELSFIEQLIGNVGKFNPSASSGSFSRSSKPGPTDPGYPGGY